MRQGWRERICLIIGSSSILFSGFVLLFPANALRLVGIAHERFFFVRLAALLGTLLNTFLLLSACRGVVGNRSVLHAAIAKICAPVLMTLYWWLGELPVVILAVAIPDAIAGIGLLVAFASPETRRPPRAVVRR